MLTSTLPSDRAYVNRHFYRYESPCPLEVIETDIKKLEGEILTKLKKVTA